MAGPNALFGVPINGFHPQMTAVPNSIAPLQCHPFMGRSAHSYSQPRRREACKSISPSCHAPLSPPQTMAACGSDDQLSLASLIDAQTKRIVKKLQHDAREMDKSRRLLKKRMRKEARRQSSKMALCVSESGSDVSKGSFSSGGHLSSRKKRRLTYEKNDKHGNHFATCSSDDCTTSSLSGFDEKSLLPGSTSSSAQTTFLDLYSDVFLASEKPQFMATLGGRIVSWNDEFLSTTGLRKSQLRGCMTVHNLIDSRCHYVLNDLFELALRGDADQDDCSSSVQSKITPTGTPPPLIVIADRNTPRDDSREMRKNRELRHLSASTATAPEFSNLINNGQSISMPRSDSLPSDLSDGVDAVVTESVGTTDKGGDKIGNKSEMMYSSVTLPCILFPRSPVPLYMTIVLMKDFDPSKRCFYCVMRPIQPEQLNGHAPSGFADGVYRRVSSNLHSTVLAAENGNSTMTAHSLTKMGVIHKITQETLAGLL